MKYLTLQEFAKATNANGYINASNNRTIESTQMLAECVSKYHPADVWYVTSEQNGQIVLERTEVRLIDGDLKFTINKHAKGWSVYCESLKDLKNVTHDTRRHEEKELQEPNRIGVLSAKKVADWMSYYRELYKRLEAINEANGSEKAAFLKSIEGLPVRWWNNKTEGEIERNGIVLKFTINTGYIYTRTEIALGAGGNLDAFLQLSDNKYVGKSE